MKNLIFTLLIAFGAISCTAQQPFPDGIRIINAPMNPSATQIYVPGANGLVNRMNISDLNFSGSGNGTGAAQALSLSDYDLSISNGGTVSLAQFAQSLSLSGNQLTLTGAGGNTVTLPINAGGGSVTTDASQLTEGTLADARLSNNIAQFGKTNTGNLRTDGTLWSSRFYLNYDLWAIPVPNSASEIGSWHALLLSGNQQRAGQDITTAESFGISRTEYNTAVKINNVNGAGLSIVDYKTTRNKPYFEITSYANRTSAANRGDIFRVDNLGDVYVKNVKLSTTPSGGGGSYTPPQIISTTANRNLATNDIGNTVECTVNSTITILQNFTQMAIGQTVNLEAHNGAELRIKAATGVTINYSGTTDAVFGSRPESVLFGVLRKIGANAYIVSGQ